MVQVHGKMDAEDEMSQMPESIDSDSFVVIGAGPMSMQPEEAGGQQPSSVLITSLNNISIVSDLSVDEIQAKLKDLVRENFELKETLQQNNMAMKEQYVLLSNFQEAQWQKTAQMKDAIAQLQKENETFKTKLQEQESEKSVSFSLSAREDKEAIEQLAAQKSALEKDIAALKKEAAAIQAAGLRLRQEKESICSQYQDLLTEVREKDATNADLQKQVGELEASLEEKNEALKKVQADFHGATIVSGEAPSTGSFEEDLDIVRGILNKYAERCMGLNNLLQAWSESLHTLAESVSDDPTSADKLKQQVEGVQGVLQKQFLQTGLDKRTLQAAQMQIDKYIEDKQRLVQSWDHYREEQDQKDHQTNAYHGFELNHLKEKLDSMTAHLMEKDEKLTEKDTELENLKHTVRTLEIDTEGIGILKAQVELYQADFVAERESRQRIVGEKEQVSEELRELQRRCEHLEEELRRVGGTPVNRNTEQTGAGSAEPSFNTREETPPRAMYECPKCNLRFATLQAVNNHIDDCLQTDMFP